MNVLSLFDGISAGQVALRKAGIVYDNYYASEIDSYAISITQYNFPKTIQIGDVTKVQASDLPDIDLLIGGSPCQGFSFAGKQLNFDDPRSRLFFEYVRLLRDLKPKYFLLENVRMKKESQEVISEALGVEPILIDSALLSAQNRKRLYWTNIEGIVQPSDHGIMLKDVLEYGECDRDKSYCIDACYYKGGSVKNYKEKARRQLDRLPVSFHQSEKRLMVKDDVTWRKLTPRECERLQTFDDDYTLYGQYLPKINQGLCARQTTIAVIENNGRYWLGSNWCKTPQATCPRQDLPSGVGYELCKSVCQQPYHAEVDACLKAGKKAEGGTLYLIGHSYCCDACKAVMAEHGIKSIVIGQYPKQKISNSQRYKALGNSWTVDVIAHILKAMR